MPGLAVLAAAAQVGRHINAALLQPGDAAHAEARVHADVEAAVGIEDGGIFAVEFNAFFVYDEHGRLRAVLAGIEHLLGHVVVGVEVHFRAAEQRALAAGDVVHVYGRRIGKAGESVEHLLFVALAAEAAGAAEGRQLHFALHFALEGIDIHAGGHVFGIAHEQLAAGAGHRSERLRFFGDDGFPVFPLRFFRVYEHHAAVLRAVVGADEELALHHVNDAVSKLARLGDERLEGRCGIGTGAVPQGVALLAFAPVGDVEEGELLVFRGEHAMEALRVGRVFIHQDVCRLRGAYLVVKHLVVFVFGAEFFARFRLWVAAVVEAVALPGHAGHFGPFDFVVQVLAGVHIAHVHGAPVAAAFRNADHGVPAVFGKRKYGQGSGAGFGELIGINDKFRFAA